MPISLKNLLRKPYGPPVVMGKEKIMSKKSNGTSAVPVQENLRWGVDRDMADRICNHNRHFAELSRYFLDPNLTFLAESRAEVERNGAMTFYDSNTGKPLFTAPKGGRTYDEFLSESTAHGWPSFRDDEVDWRYVRVLRGGECVSVDGTHLGHNLPDKKGNRYCINLVSVAGRPINNDET
uniref:MsrB domain-containing protein n=1 Tax=Pseudictyota dubia TaxID=2749911 RepID=A0A7R9WCR8_9STRA|mmetsp:Transcript_44704/g.82907  ORF Transcript_44704/g.82907 Transcript_44704/m.82907 type:complete len:180 (+) Transcript_44704:78-617(+)